MCERVPAQTNKEHHFFILPPIFDSLIFFVLPGNHAHLHGGRLDVRVGAIHGALRRHHQEPST